MSANSPAKVPYVLIKKSLRDIADEQRLAYNWSRIVSRRREMARRNRQVIPFAAMATASVLAIAIAAFFSPRFDSSIPKRAPKPLLLAATALAPVIAVPDDAAVKQHIELSDGSTLTIAPGASLEVVQNAGGRFETALHKGWVRFDVAKGKGRTWTIDGGLGRVTVLGTQFTVSRTRTALKVAVHRGTVRLDPEPFGSTPFVLTKGDIKVLTAPDTEQRAPETEPMRAPSLIAEKAATITPRSAETALTNPQSDSPLNDAISETSTGLAPRHPALGLADDTARPMAAYAEGTTDTPELERAFSDTSTIPLPSRSSDRFDTRPGASAIPFDTTASMAAAVTAATPTVSELLRTADNARRKNAPTRAADILERVVADYPTDPGFGLAALTLGNIRMDALNQPAAAARAFDRARHATALPASLREQAFAKYIDALMHCGKKAEAKASADIFRRRYPHSDWLQWIDTSLEKQ